MTVLATNTAPTAPTATTTSDPTVSRREAAIAILDAEAAEPGQSDEQSSGAQGTETSEGTSEQGSSESNTETEGATDSKPEGKPDGKTEKDPAQVLAEREAKLYEEREKLNSQFASFKRQKEKIETDRAKLDQDRRELDSLASVSDVVAYVAKRSGITTEAAWNQVVEQIRNGGKPTAEHELARLRAERQREQEQARLRDEENKAQSEAENQAQIIDGWKTSTAQLVTEDASRWPSLKRLPSKWVSSEAFRIVNEHYENTGDVPTREDVLDHLEREAAATSAPAAPAAAKPKSGVAPKAKTITNNDAAAAVDTRSLSMAERRKRAEQLLSDSDE